MSKKELVSAIREAAASLRKDPAQFTYRVTSIGSQSNASVSGPMSGGTVYGSYNNAVSHGSGTSIGSIGIAGGPGSDFSILPDSASGSRPGSSRDLPSPQEEAQRELVTGWADELDAIANEADLPDPNASAISRRLGKLADSGIPTALLGLMTAWINAVSG